jgi:hypothetical protein
VGLYMRGKLPPPNNRTFTYEPDKYWSQFAQTSSNVLIMNGLLDPQTPYQYGHTQFDGIQVRGGAHKWIADFPGATHCALAASPVSRRPSWQRSDGILGPPGAGIPCGLQTILQFVAQPHNDPVKAAACLADVMPIDFGKNGGDSGLVSGRTAAGEPIIVLKGYDWFDGVSAVTEQLITAEWLNQVLLWACFGLFVLPCCLFVFCLVHYRVKMEGQVCCCGKPKNEVEMQPQML